MNEISRELVKKIDEEVEVLQKEKPQSNQIGTGVRIRHITCLDNYIKVKGFWYSC